jgi:hypothetical protein
VPSTAEQPWQCVARERMFVLQFCLEFVNLVVLPFFVCPPFPFLWATQYGSVVFLSVLLWFCRGGEHFPAELNNVPHGFAFEFFQCFFLFPSSYLFGFFSISCFFFLILFLFVFILFLLGFFGLLLPSHNVVHLACIIAEFSHSCLFLK